MKPLHPLLLLPVLTLAPAVSRGVDFIRQIQLLGPGRTVVYDMPVQGLEGRILSKPLQGNGAVFQLYAYHDERYDPFSLLNVGAGSIANVNVALDSHLVDVNLLGIHLDIILGGSGNNQPLPQLIHETVVGTHLPTVSLTLQSADPYQPPRTRADRPFALNVSVRRLAEPGDPLGGIAKVTMVRDFKFYHPELHLPYPNGSGQGSYDSAIEFNRNGDFRDANVYQILPAESPTKASGEETFSVRVPVGDAQATIASSTIQVWPVCDAAIEGIQNGGRYTGIPLNARVACRNLYPDSVTYAQIYPGPAVLGTKGKVLGSSVISFNTYSPQNAMLPLVAAEGDIGEDGTYTLEVLTTTPFDDRAPQRVSYVTFHLDRTIQVNGSLTSTSSD